MVRIPAEYQEVEYLESTGTQHIDTGVYGKSGIECFASIMWMETDRDAGVLCARKAASERIMPIHQYPNGKWTFGYGSSHTGLSKIVKNEKYQIEAKLSQSEQYLKINGEIIYSDNNSSYYDAGCNLVIFACAYGGGEKRIGLYSRARVYKLCLKNDSLVRNFIPCYRKSDSEPGMYDTVSGTFFTNAGTGTFIVGNDVSWDTASLIERRRQILLNTPHLETISDSIASFKTDVPALVKDCKVYFEPMQEGSGDPSPDNVRPISGWDGVTVYKTGKNLFANQNGARCYVGMKAGVTYAVSYNASSYAYFRGYDVNGKYVTGIIWMKVGTVNGRRYGTITPSVDIPYGSIYVGSGVSEAQIEVGSAPTSYEPYTGTTITIPFPQTIYGGYVDLVKGEVVETWQKVVLDGDETPNAGSNYNGSLGTNRYFTIPSIGLGYNVGSGYCETAKFQRGAIWASPDSHLGEFNINTAQLHVVFTNATVGITSEMTGNEKTAAIKTWLASNPMTFVVPLATPITYQLTPETIRTLRGVNNVWSNANGNIEIDYWGH